MKKTLILAGAMALLMFACGPGRNDAVKYNDSIMDMVDHLKPSHEAFMNQIDGHNLDSLKLTHKLFSEESQVSLGKGEKIEAFGDNKEFRDVMVEYFKTINSIAINEGKQMVDIMSKDSLEITQDDLDKITGLAESFDKKHETIYEKVKLAQEKFSKEWGFQLLETK